MKNRTWNYRRNVELVNKVKSDFFNYFDYRPITRLVKLMIIGSVEANFGTFVIIPPPTYTDPVTSEKDAPSRQKKRAYLLQ